MPIITQAPVFDLDLMRLGHGVLVQIPEQAQTRQIGIISCITPFELRVVIVNGDDQANPGSSQDRIILVEDVVEEKVLLKHLIVPKLWDDLEMIEEIETESKMLPFPEVTDEAATITDLNPQEGW